MSHSYHRLQDVSRERDNSVEPLPVNIDFGVPRVNLRNLAKVCYANGWTMWHYRAERIADVYKTWFFSDASEMIRGGDHIHVSAPDGGAILLASCAGTIVSLASGTV